MSEVTTMTQQKKTLTMVSRDGNVTQEVGLSHVPRYLAWGWKPASGQTPTFVLKPPKGLTGGAQVGDHFYPSIDEAIDNRAQAVISDPADYYDVERLIEAGWEVIEYQ